MASRNACRMPAPAPRAAAGRRRGGGAGGRGGGGAGGGGGGGGGGEDEHGRRFELLRSAQQRDRLFQPRIPPRLEIGLRERRHRHGRRDSGSVKAGALLGEKQLVRQPQAPAVRQRAAEHVREDSLGVLPDARNRRAPAHERLGKRLRRAHAVAAPPPDPRTTPPPPPAR